MPPEITRPALSGNTFVAQAGKTSLWKTLSLVAESTAGVHPCSIWTLQVQGDFENSSASLEMFTPCLKGGTALCCSSPIERQIISSAVTRGTSITSPSSTAGTQWRARLFALWCKVAKDPVCHMPPPFVSCMWSLMSKILLPSSETHSCALSPTTCRTHTHAGCKWDAIISVLIAQELEHFSFWLHALPLL